MTNNPKGLSEYFANDPPSFFDELTNPKPREPQSEPEVNKPKTNMLASTFTGRYQPPEYVETADDAEEPIKVNDEVRNLWPSPAEQGKTGTGAPTHLVMPGLHIANDLGYGRSGQPAKHSPHSLQLWFTRLALLAKLGEYELLQAEAEPFGQLNALDVFYEFYPEMYSGKQGSIASFSFRLLLSEMPIYLGKPHLALDNLSKLHVISSEIKQHYEKSRNGNASEFWQRRSERVLHSIINCALMMKKYSMIDDIMGGMLLTRSSLSKEEQRSLYSAWGRIYLQIGDIFGAEQKFAVARRLREINTAPDLRDLVDKGLIAVANNDFPEAYLIFQKALHLDSGNTMILNNMGVCLLYAGKLKDAINLYERAINLNPQKSLNESLLVNLSTLYELESNNSKVKKLNLLRLINRFKPDLNISVEICLKLQATN
ncbi:CG11396 [Drosophila busckii]|uniref:CG11396 n=1 Tax=Drosophila busckii TaxID=30019 RepID=A0A0M4EQY6_DROBS|nr:CG11396 [Drosophila busckii]